MKRSLRRRKYIIKWSRFSGCAREDKCTHSAEWLDGMEIVQHLGLASSTANFRRSILLILGLMLFEICKTRRANCSTPAAPILLDVFFHYQDLSELTHVYLLIYSPLFLFLAYLFMKVVIVMHSFLLNQRLTFDRYTHRAIQKHLPASPSRQT